MFYFFFFLAGLSFISKNNYQRLQKASYIVFVTALFDRDYYLFINFTQIFQSKYRAKMYAALSFHSRICRCSMVVFYLSNFTSVLSVELIFHCFVMKVGFLFS